MLLVISPAKSLDFTAPPVEIAPSAPLLSADTARLSEVTRKLSVRQVKTLMDLSDDLASLNHARFQALGQAADDARLPAVLAFNGDVYRGLRARALDADALAWTQGRLRILSGLYGLLRPLDAIEPYRLEMGVRLRTARGKSLYDFWGDRIARALDEAAGEAPIVNLASQEYFTAARRPALKSRVITCHFREEKAGQSRIISVFAKRARGLMARYAIDRRIEDAQALKDFDLEGYSFRPERSGETDWTFARPAVTP